MVSKMELVFFIEKLVSTDGKDEQAQRAVIAFGQTLTPQRGLEVIVESPERNSDFLGFTAEQGHVTVQDKSQPGTKELFSAGPKESAGYYKVWRQNRRNNRVYIFLQNFKDTNPEDSMCTFTEPLWYLLIYDLPTLKFLGWAQEYRTIWKNFEGRLVVLTLGSSHAWVVSGELEGQLLPIRPLISLFLPFLTDSR